MIWQNLKELKCPRCYEDLERTEKNRNLFSCSCKFIITEKKIKELTEPMFTESNDHFGMAEFNELLEISKND